MTEIENPQKMLKGFDPSALFKNSPGFKFGTGDLIVGGVSSSEEVIGRMLAFLLIMVHDANGKRPFQGITVIVPPATVWKHTEEDVVQAVIKGAEAICARVITPGEADLVRRLLSVVRCQNLDAAEVLDAVKNSGQHQLIGIIDAGKYRNKFVSSTAKLGLTTVLISEDEWVPHVVTLVRQCMDIIKTNESYICFDVTEDAPVRPSNHELLTDIDNCYTALMGYQNDPYEFALKEAERWVTMGLTGRLEEALSEIEALAELPDSAKAQLSIQVLHRSGNSKPAAIRIREELLKGTKFPADMAVRFARIAERACDVGLAGELLTENIDSLAIQSLLETALECATSIGNAQLVQSSYSRLISLFAGSELAGRNRILRLMNCCQMVPGSVTESSPSHIGFTDSELHIAQALCSKADVRYEELLTAVGQQWPGELQLAIICCAIHAQRSKRSIDAIGLAIEIKDSSEFAATAAHVILWAVRRMMLSEEIPKDELEFYKLPILHIISYLAKNPANAQIRSGLSQLLSVDSCGTIGLPLIASLALDLTQTGTKFAPPRKSQNFEEVSEEEFREFFKNGINWMADCHILELGVSSLPKELIGDNPDGLLTYLLRIIKYATNQREENADLVFIERCVYLTCLLVPHAGSKDVDLDVMRMYAGKLWLEGQPQQARDHAEQILKLAGEEPQRQRIAWASFADVYHRTRSPIDAIIGISCAMTCETNVNTEDLWHEAYTLIRIARDLGLNDVAKGILPTCRTLYKLMGVEDAGEIRIDTIELGLRLKDVKHGGNSELEQLVIDVARNCEKALDCQDELLPAASLLAQTVHLCEISGISVDEVCYSTLATAMKNIGPKMADFLRAISNSTPSVEDIEAMHIRLQTARNSEDIASDMMAVVLAARRLLHEAAGELTSQNAAFAIELLAERSIDVPGETGPLSAAWPAEYARSLSEEGLAVALLGVNEAGNLISVIAYNGTIEVKRSASESSSFRRRLNEWNKDYPYQYGLIPRDHGNNDFYVSMSELDIPLPLTSKLVVIAEPSLQQVPMNLVLVEDDFIGKVSAVGTTPSLTWLDAAQRHPSNHDGRRLAWISASDDPGVAGTLETILDRLLPTFEEFGIVADTSRRIPKGFSGAQMVVVTAHGSLTAEGRFIHKITDEEELIEAPLSLAQALAGVELVILFVCSGGRLDKHPLANTTVGLPKQLLDRGCRAVIASPWPLDSMVTYRWLSDFMKAWHAGETVLAATYKANQAVQAALGDPPQYGLAMTVHGDVLLRG